MSSALIAWCGEDLKGHMAVTSIIALEVYREEWPYMARRHEAPQWILPLAAAYHDAGKALDEFQEKALSSCRNGREPSFYLHEYLGAIPILIASKLLRHDDEQLWTAVAAAGVMMHHHGMTGRLIYMGDALEEALRRKTTKVDASNVLKMARAGLEACSLALKISSCVGSSAAHAMEECLGRAKIIYNILKANKEKVELMINRLSEEARWMPREPPNWIIKSPKIEIYWPLSTFITGALSLADTIVASYFRNRKIGGYALRVLKEDPKTLERAEKLLKRAYDCL